MKNPIFLLLLGLWTISACKKNLPDAGGNSLKKTVQTIPGMPPTVDSLVYDAQQRLSAVILSGGNPYLVQTVTFQYDASGRLQSWTLINGPQGKLITYDLSYDANGRLEKELAVPLQPGIAFSDFSFAYDPRGEMISDTTYAQHEAGIPTAGIQAYETYTYDGNGNPITEQYSGSTNANFVGAPFKPGYTYTYRYDTRINPYYHAGIPYYCDVLGGLQVLSPNNLVGSSTADPAEISPYTFSFDYYSNSRPRIQTSEVIGASGPTTQTTEYFYR